MYPDVDPKIEEFHKLIPQIDISHKNLSKSAPETLWFVEKF